MSEGGKLYELVARHGGDEDGVVILVDTDTGERWTLSWPEVLSSTLAPLDISILVEPGDTLGGPGGRKYAARVAMVALAALSGSGPVGSVSFQSTSIETAEGIKALHDLGDAPHHTVVFRYVPPEEG